MAGKNAVCNKGENALTIRIDNKDYAAYKVIWKLYHNEEAKKFIHIDGNILNNSISNLKIDNIVKEKKVTKEFKISELPTQEYLLECFRYEPETGKLYWRERPLYHFDSESVWKNQNNKFANKEAGSTLSTRGYYTINMKGKPTLVHRIIWKMVKGVDPENLIDHINGDKLDNRIENLREATHRENNINQSKKRVTNTSGAMGVTYIKSSGKWRARIKNNYETIHIGCFDTLEEASAAREAKAKELHGEFYNEIENEKED